MRKNLKPFVLISDKNLALVHHQQRHSTSHLMGWLMGWGNSIQYTSGMIYVKSWHIKIVHGIWSNIPTWPRQQPWAATHVVWRRPWAPPQERQSWPCPRCSGTRSPGLGRRIRSGRWRWQPGWQSWRSWLSWRGGWSTWSPGSLSTRPAPTGTSSLDCSPCGRE